MLEEALAQWGRYREIVDTLDEWINEATKMLYQNPDEKMDFFQVRSGIFISFQCTLTRLRSLLLYVHKYFTFPQSSAQILIPGLIDVCKSMKLELKYNKVEILYHPVKGHCINSCYDL